jgi:tRNA-dihydrouridine synthase B
MRLGPLRVDNPFVQAPMAGWTDAPFRTLARRFHKGLLFTEMVSAEALCRGNKRTLEYCRIDERHHPVALQLVGHDADRLVQAAKLAEAMGPDVIDINAGCPDRKIVQQGAGGALLKKPEKLAALVEKVVKAVKTPVSVKLRLGWDQDDSVRIGKLLEQTGAGFLTFNGYLVTQKYSGRGDWKALRKVVDEVDLPIIANGGVHNEEDAIGMLKLTGASGVMLGRATRGRPDRPMTCLSLLKAGRYERMSGEELVSAIKEHAVLESELFGEIRGMSRMRKHLHWYMKAARIGYDRTGVDHIATLQDLEDLMGIL